MPHITSNDKPVYLQPYATNASYAVSASTAQVAGYALSASVAENILSSSFAATASYLNTNLHNWTSVTGPLLRGDIDINTLTTGQMAMVLGALISDLKATNILKT